MSTNKMKSRLRAVALNLTLLIVSTAGALLLAEVFVRMLVPQQVILIRPEIWQPADTVGWLKRPHVATQINTGERTVSILTDEHGLRIGRDGKREGDVHILLLGDSFMEALQVEYEQSLAGLLEGQLSQRLGKRVLVHNAGVAGWSPDQYYLRARSLFGVREFDLVITSLYVADDAIPIRRDRLPPRNPVERKSLRLPRRVSWTETVDAVLHPINDFLEVRSQLFLFFKNRLTVLRMKLGLTPATAPSLLWRRAAAAPNWEVTAGICQEISELARAHGAPALFVLVPAHYQVYAEAFEDFVRGFEIDTTQVDLEQPSRLLAGSLEARGLRVIDALPVFRAAREESERLYGTVDTHLSPTGHVVLASLVEPDAARLLGSDPTSD